MKIPEELFKEHTDRLLKAVALEKTDRVPVVLGVDSFAAQHMGITLADFVSDINNSSQIILKSMLELGDIDGTLNTQVNAYAAGPVFLSNNKLPGRELGKNDLWQVDEVGLMEVEDYDTIIDKGYNYFFSDYLKNRIPKAGADFQHFLESSNMVKNTMNFVNAGIVPFGPIAVMPPFDYFCCGRGLSKFMKDLFKNPEKVQAAADAAMVDILAGLRQQIRAAKPFGVFVGNARGASEALSPKIWKRFVWPYLRQCVEAVVEEGVVAYLHLDANWDRDLEYFRELPKGKCVWGSDHATDIFKMKEILGDHMCILGDVPAAMLVLGTPDEVYNYSIKLIKEIGPTGFILAQACYVPANAKVENVKALVAAANGK
jgi:hypothetical protein